MSTLHGQFDCEDSLLISFESLLWYEFSFMKASAVATFLPKHGKEKANCMRVHTCKQGNFQ